MHHTNATALVGLSHRGSRVETMPYRGSRVESQTAAAMRQPYGGNTAMGAVGCLGPVGFGISTVYFIVDLSTDGFYGWGAIPDNY